MTLLTGVLFGGEQYALHADAQKVVKTSGKTLMVAPWMPGCGACEKFDRDAANDAHVQKVLEKVILYRAIRLAGEGKALRLRYKAGSAPYFQALDNKNDLKTKWLGF